MATPVEIAVENLRQQQQEQLTLDIARDVVVLEDTVTRLADILTRLNETLATATQSTATQEILQQTRAMTQRYASLGQTHPLDPARSPRLSAATISADLIGPASIRR